jgi:hypothetical protein
MTHRQQEPLPAALTWAGVFVAIAAILVAVGGCAVRAAPQPTLAVASGESHTASGSPVTSGAEWQAQAQRLAAALRDVEGAIPASAEATPGAKPEGTFEARVVSVSPTGALIVDRQTYLEGEAAVRAAKLAGTSLVNDRFVVNRYRERLTVPVAPGASFVVWYPGEDATNVSPEDMASMSALSVDQFAKLFATDSGKREALQYWGGWATVGDEGLTSFVEPNTP